MALAIGAPEVVMVCCTPKLLVAIFEPRPWKVGSKNALEYATKPFTVSVTGAWVAPAGTSTVRFVALALVTTPCTAPKRTLLLAATGEKPSPLMFTTMPVTPVEGLTAVITGKSYTPNTALELTASP